MKNLAVVVLLICSINCFAQNPNPELFQTWYLRFVQSSDLSPAFNVYTIVPAITPTLVISNTLNFTGTGACNTFSGVFTSTFSGQLQTNSFTPTTLLCGSQIHNSFEGSYFGFMQFAGQYQIFPEGTGSILVMNNPIFGQAVFQNFPLATPDFELEKIAIYPNPSNDVFYLNSNQVVLTKIEVINSLGKLVKTINDGFEALAISDLSTGIYLLKINTTLGTINKKIIKK